MKKIREKLRSESGASILLALLFFLLCAMVGASVLMAAASNAGKSRSNREEQQKYLTLSSALQLVCDELTDGHTKYIAKYNYHYTKPEPIEDNEGNVTGYTPEIHTYKQQQGRFESGLVNVLPLLKELDGLFAKKFVGDVPTGNVQYYYYPFSDIVDPPGKHTLTLTLNDSGKPGLNEAVTITVELQENYKIMIKATLNNYPEYVMSAELTKNGEPELVAHEGDNSCEVKWSLSQIIRGTFK